jgi:hypothetical protein
VGHSLNLSEWLRRLGFKDGAEPPIARVIQPVQVVQDVSGLLPPTLPPSGFSGGLTTGAAGAFSALEIGGGTQGGTFVEVKAGLSAGGFVVHALSTTRLTLSNLVSINRHVYQGGHTSEIRLGTLAATIATGLNPITAMSGADHVTADIFVPPGQWAYVQNPTANSILQAWAQYQEFASEREA